jgi:hypothetical protein
MITAADASKNIRVRIRFVKGKGLVVETFANANNPGGCDKARALVEQSLDIAGDVVSATSHHPVEQVLTTPAPEQIEQVKQIQKADQ